MRNFDTFQRNREMIDRLKQRDFRDIDAEYAPTRNLMKEELDRLEDRRTKSERVIDRYIFPAMMILCLVYALYHFYRYYFGG